MQFLPDTIDAITRMIHEAGVVGAVAFMLALTISFLLYKHLGDILDVAKASLALKLSTDATMIDHLSAISASNTQILDRVGKLPSDKFECKAKNTAEMAEMMKIALAANGVILSDAETAIIVSHRKAILDQAAKETMDMPLLEKVSELEDRERRHNEANKRQVELNLKEIERLKSANPHPA